MEVKKNARMRPLRLHHLSVKDRDLLRTHIDGISGSLGRAAGRRPLTLGDHELSRRIREIAPGRDDDHVRPQRPAHPS